MNLSEIQWSTVRQQMKSLTDGSKKYQCDNSNKRNIVPSTFDCQSNKEGDGNEYNDMPDPNEKNDRTRFLLARIYQEYFWIVLTIGVVFDR